MQTWSCSKSDLTFLRNIWNFFEQQYNLKFDTHTKFDVLKTNICFEGKYAGFKVYMTDCNESGQMPRMTENPRKTSSVTPDFFYVFYRILSFSTVSQSLKKICVWEVFGRERP